MLHVVPLKDGPRAMTVGGLAGGTFGLTAGIAVWLAEWMSGETVSQMWTREFEHRIRDLKRKDVEKEEEQNAERPM